MGGYSCQRQSRYKAREVLGRIKIPNYYAGICPGDDKDVPGTYKDNIIPEMFFGIYPSSGIDIGIRCSTHSKWRPFIYANPNVLETQTNDGPIFTSSQVGPGTTLYMRAWISKESNNYYANLNISKTGYYNTDLLSTPFKVKALNAWGSTAYNSGGDINREATISANPADYERSGAYAIGMQWQAASYITPSGYTYPWSDQNSATFSTNSGGYPGASNTNVLKLRKDGGTYDGRRIKVPGVTDSTANGATETVSIDFRSTPQI